MCAFLGKLLSPRPRDIIEMQNDAKQVVWEAGLPVQPGSLILTEENSGEKQRS
jgi:hypothetical protein